MLNRQITVLLVDDHPVVRAGYRRLLESTTDLRVVAEADNGETGCKLYQKYTPDVVILDLKMPGIDGLETIHRIKAKDPAAHILVFSMYSNEILVKRALQAGATGYLSKKGGLDQMIKAVRRVNQGKKYLDQDLSKGIADNIFGNNAKDPINVLTKREFQLFKLLAEGNSIREIAETLSISPKTVGVHHDNIKKKLELKNTAQLIHLAIICNIIL
ncbi:MAG: response regulator transcription factor [Nitrosomonadaceae bacterium]|nr:response regulator transcription factor [Nitrosomonadaceae bacterium]